MDSDSDTSLNIEIEKLMNSDYDSSLSSSAQTDDINQIIAIGDIIEFYL